MADRKISAFSARPTLDGTEEFPVIVGGQNYRTPISSIASGMPVAATGGNTAQALSAHLAQRGLSVYDFGYTAGADVALSINAAGVAGLAAGGRPIIVPPGSYNLATSIVPKSYCPIIGAGPRISRFTVQTDAPYAQTSGTQLVASGISGVSFLADTGHADAVVLSLTSAQQSRFTSLRFYGFSSGKILKIAGALAGTLDESIFPATSSNVIFNTFENWVSYGTGTGIELFGHYGVAPTGSPANSSNVPDHVVTQNRYSHLVFFGVENKGIDIIGACDSEVFDQILINLKGNNSIGVDLASDAVYTGNNYCNSHKFYGLTFSKDASAPTGCTLIRTGWTFANQFDIEHDIDVSTITEFNGANSQSYYITGKRIDATSNLLMETHTKGHRFLFSNGNVSEPSLAFEDNEGTGFYKIAAGNVDYTANGSLAARFSGEFILHKRNAAAAAIGTHRTDAHGVANIGAVQFYGQDSGAASEEYASVLAYCLDNTAASEDGEIRFRTKIAGAFAESLYVTKGCIGLLDGITAPSTSAGLALIYVDALDGDLKVKFGDGTIKTIQTDTP